MMVTRPPLQPTQPEMPAGKKNALPVRGRTDRAWANTAMRDHVGALLLGLLASGC